MDKRPQCRNGDLLAFKLRWAEILPGEDPEARLKGMDEQDLQREVAGDGRRRRAACGAEVKAAGNESIDSDARCGEDKKRFQPFFSKVAFLLSDEEGDDADIEGRVVDRDLFRG